MKFLSLISLACLLLVSGNMMAQKGIDKGFETTSHGLKYKIVRDMKQPKGHIGDIIKMNLSYTTQKDSLLFSTYQESMGPIQISIAAPTFGGDPMEGFTLLGTGDSAVFLMPTDSAYKTSPMPPFAHKGEYIKIYVSVISTMTKEDFDAKEKEEAASQDQLQDKAILDYIDKHHLKATKAPSGLYYVIDEQGTGAKAVPGKNVSVNYSLTLLDGTAVESSNGTPYTFPLGQSRVIKGWDDGLQFFNEGGKGKLIIPSSLGYGSHGNGPKIGPNTVLIFDVEMVKVEDAPGK